MFNSSSKESSFLKSALEEENRFQGMDEFISWFKSRQTANPFTVEQIPFDRLDKWYFDDDTQNIVHKSGKFFSI
jgi:oxidase EvaA